MNNNLYSIIWNFIEEYLPNYYSRDDVLRSDILFRYIDSDDVCITDKEWILSEFGDNRDAIKQECLRLDKQFLSEALDNFYKHHSYKSF